MADQTGQSEEPLEFLDDGEFDPASPPPLASVAPVLPPLPPRMFSSPPPFPAHFPAQNPYVGYSGAAPHGAYRPGVLTFIGIAGLVLAILGLGTNLISLPLLMAQSRRAILADRRKPAAKAKPAIVSLPRPKIAPYAGDLHALHGLAKSDRDSVIGVIDSAHQLSGQRKQMLNRLLGESGSQIFPTLHSPLDAGAVKAAIIESDHLPDWPDMVGADFFRTSAGTVVLNHDTATFVRADGSSPVRIDGDIVTTAAGKSRSTVAIVDELNNLHQVLGPGFNAVQAAALAKQRSIYNPGPVPGDVYFNEPDPPGRRQNCMLGNTVQYTAPEVAARHVNGMGSGPFIWILPNGQVLENPWNCDPATGLALPPPAVTRAPVPARVPSPATAQLFLIDAGAGALMALLLLVVAILMVSGSSVSARAMMGWGWLKLLTILFGAATAAIATSDLSARSASSQAYAPTIYLGVTTTLAVVLTIIGLFLIRGRTIRDYFETGGSCVTVVSPSLRRKLWPFVARFFGGPIGGAVLLLVLAGSVALGVHDLTDPAKRPPQLSNMSTLASPLGVIACGFTAMVCLVLLWIARRDAKLARQLARPDGNATFALVLMGLGVIIFNGLAGGRTLAQDATQPAAVNDTPENHERILALLRHVDPRRLSPESPELRKQIEQGDFQVFSFFNDPDPAIRIAAVRGIGYPSMLNKLHIKLTSDAWAQVSQASPFLAEMMRSKDARTAQLAGVWLGSTAQGYAAELELLGDPDQLVKARAIAGLHRRKIFNAKLSHRLAELLPGVMATTFDAPAAPGDDENNIKSAAWVAGLILDDLPPEDKVTACFGILATGNDPSEIAVRTLKQIEIRQPELMPLFYAEVGHGNMSYATSQLEMLKINYENYPNRVTAEFAKMIGGTDPWVRRGAILLSARAKIPLDPSLMTLTDAESTDADLRKAVAASARLGGAGAFNQWNEQAIFGDDKERVLARNFLQRGAVASEATSAPQQTPVETPWLLPNPNPNPANSPIASQVSSAVSGWTARNTHALTAAVAVFGLLLLVLLMSFRPSGPTD